MFSILIFLPLLFVLFLFTARTEKWRWFFSRSLILVSFQSFLLILLFNWILPTFVEKGTILEEDGWTVRNIFAEPLAYFLGSEPLIIIYMLLVVGSGFAGDNFAKRKIKINASEKESLLSGTISNSLKAGTESNLEDFYSKPQSGAEKVARRATSGKWRKQSAHWRCARHLFNLPRSQR